ncbi:hypothetical protein D6783_00025 [Candidatus Woesearchaeota archaeon]|nr:MAG: hypothetical protein D6783_00025 [Candidatus Woesearchaeota archaeon]
MDDDLHRTFMGLNDKQRRHLDVLLRGDVQIQEFLDGRVMAALSRRGLVRRNRQGDWAPLWGVEEAWEEFRKEEKDTENGHG